MTRAHHGQRATPIEPWRVSSHGGHSGMYCEHAEGSVREILEAAIRAGFHTYGLSEHVARPALQWMYAEELAMGWDVTTLARQFDAYARDTRGLADEFAGRLDSLARAGTQARSK